MTKPWQRNITNHDVNHDETMTVKHYKPWRNHDRETSRTMTWTMTNHDEPWRNHDSKASRTMMKPWQRNITNHDVNHDETSRTMTNHHTSCNWDIRETTPILKLSGMYWTMTKHHQPWQNITNHDKISRTMTKHESWQNITNHDKTSPTMTKHEPWRNITNHDETSRTMPNHHETSRIMTNHD